jgi:hypothetical protein
MRRLLTLLLVALFIGGCASKYYRISTRGGKTFYVKGSDIRHDDPKGYDVFKDLATGRRVRVGANDYMKEEVKRSTVLSHQVDSVLYKGQERDEQQMLR